VTIGGDDVEWHPVDAELDEQRGADMGDAPKLHLSRPDRHDRIDLPIYGDNFSPGMLHMLDEQESLRQVSQDREVLFGAIDDDSAGHAAEHLFRDDAVRMRVIPEQARSLTIADRDIHLVAERLAWVNMDKDIIAVPLWRDAHAVEMQIARIVGQSVPELDANDVACARPEHRRQIGVVVEKAGERNVAQPNRAWSGRERRIEDAVLAANLRWLNQEIPTLPIEPDGLRVGSDRPCYRRAAEQCDELAPLMQPPTSWAS
jgi:hypothetical protein